MYFGYKDHPLKNPAAYTGHIFQNKTISYSTCVSFPKFKKAVAGYKDELQNNNLKIVFSHFNSCFLALRVTPKYSNVGSMQMSSFYSMFLIINKFTNIVSIFLDTGAIFTQECLLPR